MGNAQSKLVVESPEQIADHDGDFGDYSLDVCRSFSNYETTAEKRKFCSMSVNQYVVSPESEKSHEGRAIVHRKRMRTVGADVTADESIPSEVVGDNDVVREGASSQKEMDSSEQKMILPQSESQMRLNTQDSELESMQEQASKDLKNDLSQQLQDAKVENESLKQNISQKERIIEERTKDYRERLNALEKEATHFRNQLTAMASKKKALKEQLTKANKEAEMFNKDRDDWIVENRALQAKLVSIQEKQNPTVVAKKHCQSAAMSKLESLLLQRKEDRKEMQALKNELVICEQHLKSREMEVEELKQQVTSLKAESWTLQKDVNGQTKKQENKPCGDSLDTVTEQVSSMETEKSDLTKQLELPEKDIAEKSRSIMEYANNLEQQNATLASLTWERDNLQEKVDGLEKASEMMQSPFKEELRLTLQEHEDTMSEASATPSPKCEENERHVSESKKSISAAEALRNEIESYKEQLKSHENQVDSLLCEKEELAKKLKCAQSDVAARQQELFEKDHFIIESTYSYESRLSKLQKENESLAAKEQSQSDAISKLFKEMRATEAGRYREKDAYSEELKNQESDMKESCERAKSWGDENEGLVKQLEARDCDIKGLQTQLKSLFHEKTELTKQLKVRESNMTALETRVKSLEDENAKLTKQLEAHENDMKGVQRQVESLDEENSKLVKQLIDRGNDMEGSQTQDKQSLEDLTKRLKARESDMTGLQAQVTLFDDEKRELTKQLEVRESDIEGLRRKVKALDNEKRESSNRLKARESDVNDLEKNNKSTDDEELTQQPKHIQKEVKRLQSVKEKSEQDVKIDELQKELTECRLAYEAKLATMQKAKESLAERHSATLLKLTSAFEADQQRMQADNEKLQKQQKGRLEAIGLLQEQLDTLEDETMRLNRLNENNNKAYTAALSKLSEEKRVMQNKVKSQNKELALLRSLKDKDGQGQTKVSKLEKENKALLNKEKRLKSQVERLKGSNSQLADLKKELLRLNRENKAR